MILKFEKENNGKWYVVLPEWEGNKEDLQMVLGADILLDLLATDNKLEIEVGLTRFDNSDKLKLIKECDTIENDGCGGGDYLLKFLENKEINLALWLCDVIVYVFGNIPKEIYFKKL